MAPQPAAALETLGRCSSSTRPGRRLYFTDSSVGAATELCPSQVWSETLRGIFTELRRTAAVERLANSVAELSSSWIRLAMRPCYTPSPAGQTEHYPKRI